MGLLSFNKNAKNTTQENFPPPTNFHNMTLKINLFSLALLFLKLYKSYIFIYSLDVRLSDKFAVSFL